MFSGRYKYISEGGKDSGLCRIRHKPDHVGLCVMSDQVSEQRLGADFMAFDPT
jgi:hypothetical protein